MLIMLGRRMVTANLGTLLCGRAQGALLQHIRMAVLPPPAPPRGRPRLQVCDFGLSKIKQATFLTATTGGGGVGTVQWMAPEFLNSEPCDEKGDVYSYGVILYELVTGKKPWDEVGEVQVGGRAPPLACVRSMCIYLGIHDGSAAAACRCCTAQPRIPFQCPCHEYCKM